MKDEIIRQLKDIIKYHRDEMDEINPNTYKSGFDNGYNLAYAHCAQEVIKLIDNEVCIWSLDNELENKWNTSCENAHFLESQSPENNKYKFCTYCGRKIRVNKT